MHRRQFTQKSGPAFSMGPTWHSTTVPLRRALGPLDWVRILRRGFALAVLVFGGLVLLLMVRLIERPLCGLRRPVTPYITQGVCRGAFVLLGMRRLTVGKPLRGAGALVANHSSWLDIFALNAGAKVYFVAKSEVADWAGIGWLARATGTVFIRRDRREAQDHVDAFRARLAIGHRLLFFPEGTSTDGLRVLPFKTTLFAAFLDPGRVDGLRLQPVTVRYDPPPGADPRFYGWWGGMDFGPHLMTVLAVRRQGAVTVMYHPPVPVADFTDRKHLARATETTVRNGMDQAIAAASMANAAAGSS